MTLKSDTIAYDISARIVDTIIGNLFFCDEEVLTDADSDNNNDGNVVNALSKKAANPINEKANALKLFFKDENYHDWYQVIIKSVMRFELAMEHVSIGMA